jgi:hypothetical protein
MCIAHVACPRPSFTKVEPVTRALTPYSGSKQRLVPAGLRFDHCVCVRLFRGPDLSHPNADLDARLDSHESLTAAAPRTWRLR